MRKLPVLLILLLIALNVYAANDPGHDSLYVLKLGDSYVQGSINITGSLNATLVRFTNKAFGDYLDINANGTILGAPSTPRILAGSNQLYIDSTGGLYLNTKGGTSSTIQVGDTATNGVTLNVSGTILQQNVAVCLANGSNCPTVTSGANVTGSGTTGKLAKWTSNTGLGDSIVSETGSLVTVTGSLNTTSNLYENNARVCTASNGLCAGTVAYQSSAAGWTNVTGGIYAADTTDSVAIGTSTLTGAKLTVVADSTFANENTAGIRVVDTTATATGLLIGVNSTNSYGFIQTLDPGTSWGTENLVLNSQGGNVGIGTTNPTSKLEVIGTINATSIKIGATDLCRSDGTNCPAGALGASSGWVNTSNGNVTLVNQNGNISAGTLSIDNTNDRVGIGTASPQTQLSMTGGMDTSQGSVRHYKNVAHFNYAVALVNGTMVIAMPNNWSNTMMVVRIVGYDYSGYGQWEVVVSGYNYATSPAWVNYHAEIRGRAPFNQVRLAQNGTKNVIMLGNTTMNWAYPKIVITDFIAGHQNIDSWGSGWTIGNTTDETNMVNIVTPVVDMYTNSAGNIGIGTVTPAQKLDVNGNLAIAGTTRISSAGVGTFATSTTINGQTAWHAGNDGSGSGLDADLLDGQHGVYYLNTTGFNASNITSGTLAVARGGTGTTTSSGTDSVVLNNSPIISGTGTIIANTIKVGANNVCQSDGTNCPSGTVQNSGFINTTNGNVSLVNNAGNVSLNTLFIDNTNGRVGIGTANPGSILDVTGDNKTVYLQPTDVTAEGEVKNSTILVLRQKYDAVPGVGVGNANMDTQLQNVRIGSASGLLFTLDGTPTAFLTSAGRLGIGTTAPSAQVDIAGVAGNLDFIIRNGSATGFATFYHELDAAGNALLYVRNTSGGTTFFVNTSSRKVGIGTTAPTATLDVYGNMNVSNGDLNIQGGGLSFVGVPAISTDRRGSFAYGTQIDSKAICLADGTDCPALGGGSGNGWQNTSTLVSLVNTANNVSANTLFIDNTNAKVGIGTTTPGAPLHINTTNSPTHAVLIETGGTSPWALTFRRAPVAVDASVWLSDNKTLEWTSNMNPYGDNANALGNTSKRWKSISIGTDNSSFAGNVGIGTTNPEARLHVNESSSGTAITMILDNGVAGNRGSGISFKQSGTQRGIIGTAGLVEGSADSNMSIFSEAGSGIKFYTGGSGTAKGMWDSSGYLGIGTTAPSHPLDVSGGDYSTSTVKLEAAIYPMIDLISTNADANNRNWRITGVARSYGKFEILSSAASGGTPGVNRFTIDGTNGNIAVGGTATTNAKFAINKSSTYNSESTAALRITDISDTDTGLIMGADAANDVAYIQSLDPGTSYATRALLLNPNGGNVGIGIAAPDQPLHVNGGSGLRHTTSTTGTASTDGMLLGMDGYNSGLGLTIWNFENGGLRFGTNNVQRIAIDNNGNLGIGGTYVAFGDSRVSINGSNGNNDATFTTARSDTAPVFSILPWTTQVFLSAGVYYSNNAWVKQGDDNNAQLFALDPGTGAVWYATSLSEATVSSWDKASGVTLWSDQGNWTSTIASTRAGPSYITGGNLGVGTANPAYALDVNGYARFANNIAVNGQTPSSTVGVTIYGATLQRGVDSQISGTGSDNYAIIGSAGGAGTNNYGLYGGASGATNNYGLYITSGKSYFNGDIGINTTAPIAKLHVSGATSGLTPMFYANGGMAQFPMTLMEASASTTSTSDIAIGLNLENSGTTANTYSPFIAFSRKSTSAAYNPNFAFIGGYNTGNGPDTNWAAGDLVFGTASSTIYGPVERMRISSIGNVQIGATADANSKVKIDSNLGSTNQAAMSVIYGSSTTVLGEFATLAHRNSVWSTIYATVGSSSTYAAYLDGPVTTTGFTRIGTGGSPGHASGAGDAYVQGILEVDGSFYGPGADYAELINKTEALEPGDVVEATYHESVRKSRTAYNTKVVGIISTKPGTVLSKEHGDIPLALSGRVPIKVSAENGPIEPGDLLTTASMEGYAMKCDDKAKCQGAIVAKAMGELQSGTGKITGLVMLG